MANFKAFKDLHDFSRKLNEDDWNNGQHFQLKLKNGFKNANGSCDNAATFKVAHAQPGENHTAKFEDKLAFKSTEFGGMDNEIKATNNGNIAFKSDFTGLFKDVEGLEKAAVTFEGNISAAKGLDWEAGFKHDGKDHFFHAKSQVKSSPAFTTEGVWRPCDWLVLGEKANFDTTMKGTKINVQSAMCWPGAKGFHLGTGVSGTHDEGMKFKNLKFEEKVSYESGNNTLGGTGTWDYTTKSAKTSIVLENRQADHTWRFLAHSSGTMQALLKWQLHQACKASVNTTVDLGEVNAGSVGPFNLGFGFEVKY